MKITCTKCGHQNELGRVFCTGCGKKLDLMQKTSVEELKPSVGAVIGRWVWRIGLILGLGVVILGLGLAFWAVPVSTQLGEARAVQRVDQKARALREGAPGAALQATFNQRDLNTWLDANKERGGFSVMDLRLLDGRFVLKARGHFALPFLVPGLGPEGIPYSMAVSGRFIQGRLQINSRAIGHLPLFGGLKGIVDRRLCAVVNDLTPPESLASIQDVRVTAEQIQVTVQK